MHRLLCLFLGLLVATSAWAETFRLKDGRSVTGDPISYTDKGLTVKTADGSYPRTEWSQLTQESLRSLRANPQAAPFVEPLIELTEEEREQFSGITISEVPRIDRPSGRTGLVGMLFATGIGWFLIFLAYLGNLFAAYEVALYRAYSPQMVCGVSAVVPWIGPIVMFAIPRKYIAGEPPKTRLDGPLPDSEEAEETEDEEEVSLDGSAEALPAGDKFEEAPVPEEAGGPLLPEPVTYSRGVVTFNRRFFETKLGKFAKMQKPEDIEDLVLLFKTSRGDHQSRHITKLEQTAMTFQVAKGDASTDVTVPYLEIYEVTVKHKDLL